MRIGVYGGTFNPVHNGHVKLALAYLDALKLDRLIVIPTRVPPHKQTTQLIDGAKRLEMCRLAFADMEKCEVSDIELRRRLKSYTVDTLTALQKLYKGAQLYLIMGSDMFFTLTEWRQWERIFKMAVMCVASREPDLLPELEAHAEKMTSLGASCRIVGIEPVVISSSRIRAMVCRGDDVSGYVPEKVADYIEREGLYRITGTARK